MSQWLLAGTIFFSLVSLYFTIYTIRLTRSTTELNIATKAFYDGKINLADLQAARDRHSKIMGKDMT